MSEPHPTPVAYYLIAVKDLQIFSENFPNKARNLLKKVPKVPLEILHADKEENHTPFFLPKRSDRFYLGEDAKDYATTYEALCAHLAQQGKTYKEIGTILSMGLGTVKTHLMRLKARTGLPLQDISLQLLYAYGARINDAHPVVDAQKHNQTIEIKRNKPRKQKF